MSKVKIIQIQYIDFTQYDPELLFGLGSDGVTYCFKRDEWTVYAPAIDIEELNKLEK